MIIRECTLSDLDEVLESVYEEYPEYFGYEIETGHDMILASPFRILIPTLDYSVRTGTYCIYNRESGCFDADFDLTLVYAIDEVHPDKYLFWEQDGVAVALHNFCNYVGKEVTSCNYVCKIELLDN